MNLKEQCAVDGITLAEGKEKYGLTHWKQEVIEAVIDLPSEEAEEIVEEAAEEVVEIVEEAVKEVAKVVVEAAIEIVSKEDKIKSVRGLGTKSPYWSELRG